MGVTWGVGVTEGHDGDVGHRGVTEGVTRCYEAWGGVATGDEGRGGDRE